jgi:hypothetical protein
MLVTTLWAYQIAYNVTIQYTPFELVYGIQPIMSTQFAIPTKRVCNLPQEDLNKVIQVRTEDLFRLNEIRKQAKENINHIQLLCKEQRDEKGKIFFFKEGELILWLPKATKTKGG